MGSTTKTMRTTIIIRDLKKQAVNFNHEKAETEHMRVGSTDSNQKMLNYMYKIQAVQEQKRRNRSKSGRNFNGLGSF